MKQPPQPVPFSRQLDQWLKSRHPKTIAGLINATGEKSFAIVFLVLMAIPALPIPTGGITHVFELIVMLLALELVAGRRTIWLPKKWLKRPLGKTMEQRSIPYLIKKITWFEKHSHPRWGGLLANRLFLRGVGLIVFGLTLGAFLAPPFSGLDTIPSLGVVGVALGLILEDFVIYIIGVVVGIAGVFIEIGFGAAITQAIRHFF